MSCAAQYVGTRAHGCLPASASPKATAGLKCAPEIATKTAMATARVMPCASATSSSAPPLTIAPAPMKKNQNVPQTSASKALLFALKGCPPRSAILAPMADFRPVEATKARILTVHPAPPATEIEDAKPECIEGVLP